jgi:large subunit ribosomal protein L18
MSKMTVQQKKVSLKRKIRAKVSGTAARPRLAVFRSNQYMYAQLIDDTSGKTLLSSSDQKATGTKMDGAVATGKEIAKLAAAKGIKNAVFDRGGFRYAGRIKALADAAREAGLEF